MPGLSSPAAAFENSSPASATQRFGALTCASRRFWRAGIALAEGRKPEIHPKVLFSPRGFIFATSSKSSSFVAYALDSPIIEWSALAGDSVSHAARFRHPKNSMAVIKLNGEEFQVGADATVSSLLRQLELKTDRVAVELDRSIVPRGSWAATKIPGGASVEVVHFVGGG